MHIVIQKYFEGTYTYASLVTMYMYVLLMVRIAYIEIMCIFICSFYQYLATSEQGQEIFRLSISITC
jgi:hypothetical protein